MAKPRLQNADSEETEPVNDWIKLAMRIGVSSALHPFEYAKVLIQIGFEPIAPRRGSTLFGRPALVLPNIFQYIGYIKSVDGLAGCYRALTPKLVGQLLSLRYSEEIADNLGVERVSDVEAETLMYEDYDDMKTFEKKLKRDVVVHSIGIIISQPFHVITVRAMAQFVGRETKYDSLFGSIVQIYKDEGIMGFFSGLFPKLLCDLACLVAASGTTYFVCKNYLKDKEHRQYFGSFCTFAFGSIFYPLNVVSTCMAISGCGLRAGSPPFMPKFSSWRQCYNVLQMNGQHKRGSSLFFRYVRPNQLKDSNNF